MRVCEILGQSTLPILHASRSVSVHSRAMRLNHYGVYGVLEIVLSI